MKPAVDENPLIQNSSSVRPLGLYKHEKFCADGYDIDEDNDEIARMFGVIK